MSTIKFKLEALKSNLERNYKMPRLKFRRQTVINKKKLIIRAVLVAAAVCFIVFFGALIDNFLPFSLTVKGENICYMNKVEAEKLTNLLAEEYAPNGATIKAITSDGDVTIDKRVKIIPRADLVDSAEASAILEETMNTSVADDIKITTLSMMTTLEDYTPEPEFEKDETMLAGDEIVKKKGKKGTQNVTRSYLTINRKVESVSITKKEVVNEGTAAIIKKGTLGLPEGADWRTYEGDPVFENGEEVAETALTYLGAPYKYGGTSLETGIDCVAFVVQMYRMYGINLPSSHSGLQNVGTGVSLENARKGDIVCYGNHVAIYLGNGKVVEASSRGGVRVGKLKTGRVVAIRRVVR